MAMKRFIIERDIPGIGAMSLTELCGAARASNKALTEIGSGIQWQHSYGSIPNCAESRWDRSRKCRRSSIR